jgi:multidrug efflux pump subunit AcrA (membrane-fusion protein)
MKKDLILRLISGVVIIASVALAIWLGSRQFPETEKSSLPVAPARQGEFVVVIRCRGSIQAARATQIYAPLIPNLRLAWMAPQGELIEQDEPIIRFDSSTARQELIQKQAAVEQAEASLAQAIAEGRITKERDQSDLKDARLEVELAKLKTANNEFMSRIETQQAQINLQVAEQKLKALEAEVAQHVVSTEAKAAALTRVKENAEAELELTQARLAGMEMLAPSTGYPLYAFNPTQLIQANPQPFRVGDSVAGGVTLGVIPDLATLFMDATVEETDRGRMSVGDEVVIRIDAIPELRIPAKLTGISPLAELSLDTFGRSFHVYAELGAKTDARLRPGMNGGVDVVLKRIPNAIAIPAQALFTRAGDPAVFVMEETGYRMVKVEVLARNPDEVAISGIAGNARVALGDPEIEPSSKASSAVTGKSR